MILLKCKMCGGDLEIATNASIAECEYCGTCQTIPNLDDEKKTALFERANFYRSKNEFDQAASIYETILQNAKEEAEAYWGLCLCRYGIEYVVDPKTKKRIPTCHRTQFKSILDDPNYHATLKYAEPSAMEIYRSEAEYIDNVQKEILLISSKEDPFDIFICYKETDANDKRTVDSVIAQDIYTALTEKGYRVFFSRITLEDKLGIAYEPYIFAALNSAKIMLVVGTCRAHFDAVWVKNEWSRFISLIENGQKKTLISCYRDMSPYEMPEEFSALQALDVSRLGYMQDLLRGVEKILPLGAVEAAPVKTVPAKTEYSSIVLSRIVSVVASHETDYWAKGSYTSTFNTDYCRYASFQVFLTKPIGFTGQVTLNFKVTDALGNVICNDNSPVNVTDNYDRFAKIWILRGDDGTSVADGIYTVTMQVNNSRPMDYKFRVESGSKVESTPSHYIEQPYDYSPKLRKRKKSLGIYLFLCLFFGFIGLHSFYAGNSGKGKTQLMLSLTGISSIWAFFDFIRGVFSGEVPEDLA